jgi:hypothetical protein
MTMERGRWSLAEDRKSDWGKELDKGWLKTSISQIRIQVI